MRPTKLSPKRLAVLNERAHAMRHAPTPSEAALFRLLSGRKLGAGFKRQVEVDGPVHQRRGGADARKDRALRRLGYRVLRVNAALVLEQPLVAVALIREALEA